MTNSTSKRPATAGVGAKAALLSAVVLTLALLIFVLQNTVHAKVNFLVWSFDLAQGVSLLGAAVVGALIAVVVSAAVRLRRAVR